MSVEQFVTRWRLEIGWIMLLLGWMSVVLDEIYGLLLVVLCIMLIIAGMLARGSITNPTARFRDRPFGEKALIVAGATTLIGASVARYYFKLIPDLGSVIMPVNVVFLLVSPGPPKASKRQV